MTDALFDVRWSPAVDAPHPDFPKTPRWDPNEDFGDMHFVLGKRLGSKDRRILHMKAGLERAFNQASLADGGSAASNQESHSWPIRIVYPLDSDVTILPVFSKASDADSKAVDESAKPERDETVVTPSAALAIQTAALSSVHRRIWLVLVVLATVFGMLVGLTASAASLVTMLCLFSSLAVLGLSFTWFRAGGARA